MRTIKGYPGRKKAVDRRPEAEIPRPWSLSQWARGGFFEMKVAGQQVICGRLLRGGCRLQRFVSRHIPPVIDLVRKRKHQAIRHILGNAQANRFRFCQFLTSHDFLLSSSAIFWKRRCSGREIMSS